jgi:hypothetical protein
MGGRGYGCGTDAETDNENGTDRTDIERQLASAMFSVRRNRTRSEQGRLVRHLDVRFRVAVGSG